MPREAGGRQDIKEKQIFEGSQGDMILTIPACLDRHREDGTVGKLCRGEGLLKFFRGFFYLLAEK
jgi:hypothetical protein